MNAFTFETVVTADRQLYCELPASFPVGSTVRVTVEPIVRTPVAGDCESTLRDPLLDHYQPRTELGRTLIELRQAYIKNGGKLMSADEINEEVRRRRGG